MKRFAFAGLVLLGPLVAGASRATATGIAPAHRAPGTGTLTGVVTDATSGKPLAHVLITVGYLTDGYRRAGETDARGRYTITGLPATGPRGIDTYAFTPGYFYHHGQSPISAGKVIVYSYGMPRDTTTDKHPRILSYYGNPPQGGLAHFGMRAVPGNGPFSYEMLAISPQLGRLVVLGHGPTVHYDGTLAVPRGIKGVYRFYYVATQENCYENRTFPYADVRLG